MIDSIIGTKISQGQTFLPSGRRIPVTNILAGPCLITCVRTVSKDGYNAVQLGLGNRRATALTNPELGHLKKAGLEKNPPRFLREVKVDEKTTDIDSLFQSGLTIKVADVFKVGDCVQVTGTSKGKGFAGVVKRHHFAGGPRTHGQSDRERAPGAIGQTTTPGRVYKGKRMAGRMGNQKITIKNLQVVAIDPEKNLLVVKGLVPGARNSLLLIKKWFPD
ncbi:50S ribosomal protein L3 [Candidatus Gottesmanbacteria bacterium]|nr:50S ribosomal protein L3 [Candidatus Gottesmanbacteria bacterium]